MRDAFRNGQLLKQMVSDLKYLLNVPEIEQTTTIMSLWDDKEGLKKFGVQYHEFEE